MAKENTLIHVAFIMDGNGRWAKAHGLPRHLGHKEGCERVTDIYEECLSQGIKVMSLYAFSTENWNRPKDEIRHLFTYLDLFFKREIKKMIKPILWTIVAGITIVLAALSKNGGIWAYVIALVALACAFLQWMVWRKNNK